MNELLRTCQATLTLTRELEHDDLSSPRRPDRSRAKLGVVEGPCLHELPLFACTRRSGLIALVTDGHFDLVQISRLPGCAAVGARDEPKDKGGKCTAEDASRQMSTGSKM